jgi:hypothetical protein
MLKVADMIDRQIQLCMSKVTNTLLKSLPTGSTSQQLSAYSQSGVYGPIGDWTKRSIVKLKFIYFGLGDLQDVA